ncbi:MFS transporter [Pseudolysinimonas sp.]|uniref:MFS transporter n=1 Tax=Pseudolysinimonas sp. TaxID=2680009 RepID=UPI003F7DDEF1
MSTAPASAAGATSRPFPARFTVPLLLGSTLNPINSSMLATGLAGIAADFHVGPGQSAALVSVLYLCSAVAQPTMGKLAQLFGPRTVFLTGIAILFAGGVVGSIAPAFWVLLVSRALIGIGTSAAYPTGMALVRRRAETLGVGVPSRIIGSFSIAAQITVVLGLPLGGLLTGAFGWRALFLVNVPVAIVVFLFAFLGIAHDERRDDRPRGRALLAAVDIPGILLFAGATVSLLVFLSDLTAPVWWLVPVIIALTAGLILWERRAAQPLIDVRMLAANGPLQRTYLRQIVVGLGVYTGLYGISQWMEEAAGYSAVQVGLLLLPLSGVGIVLARLVSTRGWVRGPLLLGAVALMGTGVVALVTDHTASVLVLVGMTMLFGATNGLSNFANQTTLYVQSPSETFAVASGLYRTASYLGAIFSASVIGLSFGSRVSDAGFHVVAWILVGIGALALLMTAADRRIPTVVRERAASSSASRRRAAPARRAPARPR